MKMGKDEAKAEKEAAGVVHDFLTARIGKSPRAQAFVKRLKEPVTEAEINSDKTTGKGRI